jgi:hypothetical protein
MPDIAAWQAQLDNLNANPGDIQALNMAQLQDTLDGTTDLADPTNPFVFLMEASSVNTASAIQAYENYTRLQYGSMAQTPQQLYVQMSDIDYLDRFAIPSNATIQLAFEYNELVAAMVPTGVNNISQITIPQYTAITVNGVTFTMQYPINIIQMSGGGLQITYDNSQLSPVQTLESNIVQWEMVSVPDGAGQLGATELVQLTLPLQQFAIQSQIGKINSATGFVQTYTYDDSFYYCRAFSIDSSGNLTEILTTHTDQVFDPDIPTLLLQDLGGSLQVQVPLIYITNGTLAGEVQIDIYTTKGPITIDLSQYSGNSSWSLAYNGATSANSQYVAPITSITTMMIYSSGTGSTTEGGQAAMTFAQLRQQVLTNNFGPVNTPITPSQLSNSLSQLGYTSVIDIDDVTDRIVTATRALPAPTNGVTVAGAAMTIQTLVASTNQLVAGSTVANNGDRITLLPTTLYQLINGQISVVTDAQLLQMKQMANDALANALNAATYLYSPFHYVLDSTNDMFELRPYYLGDPDVNNVQFIEANESAGITVGTADKELVPTSTGYRLRIQCQSSQSWKNIPDSQVFCQIAFIPEGETDYAYMNGTLIGTAVIAGAPAGSSPERIFEFDITTNWDADSNDNLSLTSFQMFNDSARVHAAPMTGNFMVFWIAQGVTDSQTTTTNIDNIMGVDLLPTNCLGLAQEEYNIELGVALDDGLWHRSRTVAGSGLYQVYPANVYEFYTEVVYATDGQGNYILSQNGDNVQFEILHNIGDPVLNSNGQQVVLHAAGSPVLDNSGNPIPISAGTLTRQCDLFLIEGVYYFVTDPESSAYASTIAPTIVGWITSDLATLSQSLIEETDLYFYPQISVGDVEVLVTGNTTASIEAEQQLSVIVKVDEATYDDPALQQPMEQQIIQTLWSSFQSKTVSLYQIQQTLGTQLGTGVVGLTISGLGGSLDLDTLTVLDGSASLSIWHQAVVEADGTLGVTDGVAITFLEHDTTATLTSVAQAATASTNT